MSSLAPSASAAAAQLPLASSLDAAPGAAERGELRLRDGLRLSFLAQGRGAPLLLVHGFSGCAAAWGERLLGVLAQRARVIAVDLPGHGESDRPLRAQRYALREIVADLCELASAQAPEPALPPLWIGYSLGARAALAAAVWAPQAVRALVLEGGSPGLRDAAERSARARADAELADALERDGIAPFVERWLAQPLFATQRELPAALRERERERRLQGDPRALAACLRGLGSGVQPPLWDELAQLRAPALLLAGERDAKFRAIAEQCAAALPAAQLAWVPGAGHAAHLERPQAYLGAVLPFLERVLGPAAAAPRKSAEE